MTTNLDDEIIDGEIIEDHLVDVDLYFGLSYASYLVVNRSLLQSMPMDWQHRFTAVMDEMWRHFGDSIPDPSYRVNTVDPSTGRFVRDPIPHYNRCRTFIPGVDA